MEADARLGQLLGHFRILRKLGQGGMGVVYQALDESLQRYVALKVIHTAQPEQTDTAQVQRLLQEAIAQARVNHPHIVHIYYVGREDKTPFLAMELVGGPTLASVLASGPLPFARVVKIAEQISDALHCAATFDIVHGDIKPGNLLLADEGTVKLSDFGLARRVSQAPEGPPRIVGSPNYLSPEAVDGQSLDIRSDLYSLGVTLFEMTFGRLPYSFSGGTLFEYLQTHRTAAIEFPEPWPASVPRGWRDVLERLLAKAPEDRFQSYEDLQQALRRLRPVSLPKAGRVQRGLAWAVDLALAHAAQQVFYGPLLVATALTDVHVALRLALAAAGGTVPLLAAYLQGRWRATPGKRLFQLRIVDAHGLTPPAPLLMGRGLFQLFPLCISTVWHLLAAVGLAKIANFVAVAALWLWLLDIGWAALRRTRQSLHDQLFGTQVVLDAGERE